VIEIHVALNNIRHVMEFAADIVVRSVKSVGITIRLL